MYTGARFALACRGQALSVVPGVGMNSSKGERLFALIIVLVNVVVVTGC